MANRDLKIADVKVKCPVFQGNACPYTGLKGDLSKCPAFAKGCIVNPGQCSTCGEVTDVLQGLVPSDEKEKHCMVHVLEDVHLLAYKDKITSGKKFPLAGCPFAYAKNGEGIIQPASAVGSVFITMDDIKRKCPVFNNGKVCPYNVTELNGLAKGCPAFNDGCPFKTVKDIGEFRDKLGQMRDQCKKGKPNYTKALDIVQKVNKDEAGKLGRHCSFHQYGCEVSTDLNKKPIIN